MSLSPSRPQWPLNVFRDKAALSSGCKSRPATAPAGSNRSSHGGNEMAEAFGVAGHVLVYSNTGIADVLRSEGRPADPSSVLNGSGVLQIFWILLGGLTLDQEAEILKRNSGKPVKLVCDLSSSSHAKRGLLEIDAN